MRVPLFAMPDPHPHPGTREHEASSPGISAIAGSPDRRHPAGIADLVRRRRSARSTVCRCLREYTPGIVGLFAFGRRPGCSST